MRNTVLCLFVLAAGCRQAPEQAKPATQVEPAAAPSSGLADRDPALARRLVRDEGALLIDVRTAEEFEAGHVDGAILIPHDELPDRLEEVLEKQGGDKTKPIVVYCKSGGRAGKAKATLTEAGYENVSNLGGFTDWCEDC